MRNLLLGFILLLASIVLLDCDKGGGPSEPSIPDPIASFTESGEPVTPASIAFQNTSQNADSYIWRFGDGDTTTITNPSHTYNTKGTFIVTLVATNNITGKSNSTIKPITITPGKVFIESIRINDMPFTDSYGAGWDLFSGPDVYPDLMTPLGAIISLRNYYALDVAPSDLPLQWFLASPYQISNWTTTYFIMLWDWDASGDDYIGASNNFKIDDIIATQGYQTTIVRENSSGTISTTITLRWQ